MDKEDLEEFREAIVKMSDDDDDEAKVKSAEDREKLLEEYQQEASQLEQENNTLRMENNILSDSVDHGEYLKEDKIACLDPAENLECVSIKVDECVERGIVENSHDKDDLSSIFSEDEEELRSLVEGNDAIKNALKNLRKERDFWITDTASETSDDGDTSVSARSLRDSSIDKIQISKLLADKEFLELKLSQVTQEKLETQTRLKYLEKGTVPGAKRHRDPAQNKSMDSSLQTEHSISNTRPSKDDLKHSREKPRDHSNSLSHQKQQKHKAHSVKTRMSDDELVQFLKSRSISPQLVKGYENDIALLAEENEKLGEIIDHLHITPDNEQTPRVDPMDAFMDAFENRVPKEEYLRLENEKTKLEHALREKERQIKERDRMIEESKFDYEDELKLLKETLKRTEEKMREKSREANEYEIQIIELKSSFQDQLENLENELSMENEQKMRLEEINMELANSNKILQRELEELRKNTAKLQAREKEIQNKYNNDLRKLEEKFLNENREKTHLSGNLEGLMSDLMVLKKKLLEESDKTGKMREEFEKERLALGGAPLPSSRRHGKLALAINLRSQMRPNSDGETAMGAEAVPHPTVDHMESMDLSKQKQEQIQQDQDVSKYEDIIEEQKEKIGTLEKMVEDLESSLLKQKTFADEGKPNELRNEQHADNRHNNSTSNSGASQPATALKHQIDQLEEENVYLKQKMEELGKEKSRRRELQEKNEELLEEINQMARKRNDLQRKQENMNNEIEEMNEKVEEFEKSNARLSKEADRLTNKIKAMEESFNEEKASLTSSFEKQKEMSEKELNNALEKEQQRSKEMEDEVENMKEEISSLLAQMKDMENEYGKEVEKSNAEVEKERENVSQLKDEVRKNEDAVRKVTEDWEQMLKNTAQKYEEELRRLKNQGIELPPKSSGQDQHINNNRDDFLAQDAFTTNSIPDNLGPSVPRQMENKVDEKQIVRENILPPRETCYVGNEVPLEENVPGGINSERAKEPVSVVSKVMTENRVEHERLQAANGGVEFEYMSMMPNLQIQVELEDNNNADKSGSDNQMRNVDNERIKKLEEEKNELRNALNQKLNAIQELAGKCHHLEQQLSRKDEELALLAEQERNTNNILKSKLEENSKYYQGMLENLKEKLQNEKKELENRLSKESEEMQQLMKEEFQRNLASKSSILENKIHDLVAEKVRGYKEQIQKLELALQNEKDKLSEFQKSKDEVTKRLEREKKLLRVTIDALTKELNKAKQDKKDVKKEYKKAKAGMQQASEEERKLFTVTLEKAKEVQKLKIEEEQRARYRVDVEKYEERLEAMNGEMQQYENKIEEITAKFKEEKLRLENDLQYATIELENVRESQKEFKKSLEEEYRRKLRKEKENIESTLESLRQEITRLREHRMQLESQLQQHAKYKPEKDSGYSTGHAQSAETILNNKEIFTRIENEYQKQLQKEKEYYENKIREMEKDYESLTEEMSSMKTKYRQERVSLKAEFEIERREMEERYEREKRDLQGSMQMRMQGLRDPRVNQHVDRGGTLVIRNRRLQSEVDILQDKISRLESLSPRLIDMAQRSSLYGGSNTMTPLRSSAHSYQPQVGLHSSTMGLSPSLYPNDIVANDQMMQSSNRGNLHTQYSGMYANNQQGTLQGRPDGLQQPVSNSSMMPNDAPLVNENQASIVISGNSHAGGQVEVQSNDIDQQSSAPQHYGTSSSGGMVETLHDPDSSDLTPALDH